MGFRFVYASALSAMVFLAGCTTEEAKKAMNKPMPTDQFSGFDQKEFDKTKHTAEKPKPVSDDMDADKAVSILVEQLQNQQPSYAMEAEAQLNYWGGKPGVAQIVAHRVRPLLKSARIEQRAPAVRLTVAFGGENSVGDLIECLGDKEYGIRETAYNAILSYGPPRSFGYDSSAGQVAQAQSIDQFRRWWQYEQQKGAVQSPSIYEKRPPDAPTVSAPLRGSSDATAQSR